LGASSAATLTLPVAVRRMIDQGFESASNIDAAFAILAVCTTALALATAARFFFVSLLGERVVADLRERLYGHLIGLDPAFFETTRSGELVSRLSADTELLRSLVGSSISVALRSFVMVLGSIGMMIVTSPRLASFTLIGIPLFVLPIVLGSRRLRKISRQSQDRVADANALASEVLGNIRTVQSHAREPYERGRFIDAVQRAVATARKRIGMQAIVTAVAMTAFLGAIVIVLWSGAHDVVAHRMSAGTLGQFLLYAMLGGGSVGALAEVWNDVQRASGGMGRINDLMVEQSQLVAPGQPGPAARAPARRNRDGGHRLPLPDARGCTGAGRLHAARAAGRNRCARRPLGRRQEHGLRACCCASMIRSRAWSASMASTCANSIRHDCANRSRSSRKRRRSLPPARPTTSATAAWKPATRNCSARRAPPRRTSSSPPCPRGTRANSGNAARACRAASSNASRSRARC
jgi:ABC-type multidrug transport system fused ATPase/permease subunit